MFDIPMAVQPMKSIAAVALAAETSEEFTIESMLAAGMITATFVMVLGLTGLIDAFNKYAFLLNSVVTQRLCGCSVRP